MAIDIKDYFTSVSLGRVNGHDQYFKFGVNEDIDVAEDIISQGGNVEILDANTTCEIVSDNANDTSNGTGTQQVAIFGASINSRGGLEIKQEVKELNGTNPVSLDNEYIAIWRIRSIRAGSNRTNVGTISLSTTGGTLLAIVDVDKGSTLSTLMVIPEGYTMIIYDVFMNMGVVSGSSATRKGTITARVLNYMNNATTVEAQVGLRDQYSLDENFRLPLSIEQNQFIWFRADFVENNNTAVQVSYSFELVKNISR